MAKKSCIRLIAEILEGTQVPRSLGGILGTAIKPWDELRTMLGGIGWRKADEFEINLRRFITEKSRNGEK